MGTILDTVVIGGGAMGSAAAWALARRGRQVTLLEQFGPGHHIGASHGTTRNLNPGYHRPEYVAMLAEALALWEELEVDSGERLLTRTGIVNHGPDPHFTLVQAALTEAGLRAEFLRPDEAAERWRGIRFDQQVLYMPDGGQLNPEAALPAFQRLAAARGAEIRHHTKVVALEVMDDGVRLTVESGGVESGGASGGAGGTEVLTAAQAVVTAGGWTEKLLSGAAGRDTGTGKLRIPRLRVTQEQPAHFGVADEGAVWPGFNHMPGTGPEYKKWYSPVYGMQTPGEGIKAGWHGVGPQVDPDRRSFLPEPVQLAALQDYARTWLPGVDADSFEPISCTYTTTPDEDFILDRIGPLVIGAGFSGHGFKFTPVVGRILADLATGTREAPAIFSASR
ncbi:FAD-dependent oxidoreductase [Pseudarthrobacter sp. BIM B-2242]|uniref:FAD-dependent oxidoreductase n=1 Tax=Pseudarthrobacter sp. BIM B-2242 TaxID=2772401 RepID=UPI00168B364C|nr:FAD-dependent oxidoreductase [Pseudarthrobacter sp. BIM B-2242]QOD03326.1 FAD-dependent oxidoreductase [Pseudarthrobacter sp. BIM B-2242]